MRVKNQKCIRHLSIQLLSGSKRRNTIAIFAIILTTLLFTLLFTVALSINSSYQIYQFRQAGGYSHGAFKEVTREQKEAISAHPRVKESGVRNVIGICDSDVFKKIPAEFSFMDANCTRWRYAEPVVGRMPKTGREITMDTWVLKKLNIEPRLGVEIPLTFTINDKSQSGFEKSDTFILVGYWEYDDLMPVHYLNISQEYATQTEREGILHGMKPFRTDLEVMMSFGLDIRNQMEQVEKDLGFSWEDYDNENYVGIGINEGYTSTQMIANLDVGTMLSIIWLLILVIVTGYLIIYNVFQISVAGDIRFYGLLKAIGTTSRQLKHIIRQQVLFLCMIGIPIGLMFGYGVGVAIVPMVMKNTSIGNKFSIQSRSPLIFFGASFFALATILFSCAKPERIAGGVSPVEAIKYIEVKYTNRKKRTTCGARVHQMAFANLGRNKGKTILILLSLSLSVVLLNMLYVFVGGFDLETYVGHKICADFIVGSTDYFHFQIGDLPVDSIDKVRANTDATLAGCGYKISGNNPVIWMDVEDYRREAASQLSEDEIERYVANTERKDKMVDGGGRIEGIDECLLKKLTVVKGNLAPLTQPDSKAIAVKVYTDGYGNVSNEKKYPKVGDILSVSYVQEGFYIDVRTGEKCNDNTPEEYLQYHIEHSYDVDYRVCALVEVPYTMSYRNTSTGYDTVLTSSTLIQDSRQEVVPIFYLFDVSDGIAEVAAERYLSELTGSEFSSIMYESKAIIRAEFTQLQKMFLLIGGMLCVIIGIIGILNYFNVIMMSMISRRGEFAVLQAVGMTGKQLKAMLVYEGMFYTLGATLLALIVSVILEPLICKVLENMFWFFQPRFTVTIILYAIPVFVLFGWLIPSILYKEMTRNHSVIERLREIE